MTAACPPFFTCNNIMNIVLINHSFPPRIGGAESNIEAVALALKRRGHRVSVIIGTPPKHYPLHLSKRRDIDILLVPGLVELTSGSLKACDVIPALYKQLRRIDPDIIHVHNFGPAQALAYCATLLRAKIFFTFHSTPIPEEHKIVGLFNDFTLERAYATSIIKALPFRALICPSKYYFSWARQLGVPRSKLRLVYHGVDTSLFTPRRMRPWRRRLGLHDNDFVVCSPTRLIRRKGILDVLDAALLIPDVKVKFVIPGSSWVPDRSFARMVIKRTRSSRFHGRITMLSDTVAYRDMPLLYSSVDAVALASHTEGLGLTALEALACGKPLVATNTTGFSETIVDRINGILVPPKRPDLLAAAITELKEDVMLRDGLVRNGRKTIASHFTIEHQVQELEHVYKTS